MPKLILQNTETKESRALEVDTDSILVGRNREAEVSIRDRSVSKNQLRIEQRERGYPIRALGSRNGT